ncbi:MAG: Crp/Fnr family transcriptional regulator [Methylibium sp.]|uniref:Crp/Fnr family transcriptional regulator n=1 Tax=Methylibium sp. TaxID=2067992 RepID=UPI0017C89F8E|nr:Crp/Fnr family transcriptional regulator [Methylibium sp.]MBA3598831.1 Crp/Fnr family transcriptional regulator [Methylibium sp.]
MLPAAARQRLHSRLEQVAMPLGATLHEAGAPAQSAWFPTTAIVSLLCGNQDGSCTEIAAIGHEGMIGIGIFMGAEGGLHRAVVRGEGHAWRIDAQWLKQEFERGEAATHLLLRYTQTLMMQMAQTAVCNRHHSLEQQLCRWLLGSLDRSPHVELTTTHELIAGSLGVRREGITQAAGRLRRRGLIECHRGRIGVIDRHGLEARVCECYAVVKTETARLLPEPPEAA